MKHFLFGVALAALLLGSARRAHAATVLTFDDLPNINTGFQIPNGYGGLNWSNFYVLDPDSPNPSGYKNGLVSPSNVAFNFFGRPASVSSATPFTFNSAYLTGAWNDGLNIEVLGFNGNTLLYNETVVVNTSGPTLETFNYQNITSLEFISFGGTHHNGFPLYGTQFAMDNFTFTGPAAVPEPASLTLLGIGVVSQFVWVWLRRKKGRLCLS